MPGLSQDKYQKIKVVDLTTLLYNVSKGAQSKDVGWEDASLSLNDMLYDLNNYSSNQKIAVIESALWSCNLLSEKGKFWDAKGRKFDQFVKDLMPNHKFNKDYNFLTEKGEV